MNSTCLGICCFVLFSVLFCSCFVLFLLLLTFEGVVLVFIDLLVVWILHSPLKMVFLKGKQNYLVERSCADHLVNIANPSFLFLHYSLGLTLLVMLFSYKFVFSNPL